MKKQTAILTSFLFFSFVSTIFAQSQRGGQMSNGENVPKVGIIKGIVMDASDNKPIEYANIVLFRMKDSTMVTGTITNGKGEFRMVEVPYGKFYLVANFIGYYKKNVSDIRIMPQQTEQTVDIIKLNPGTTNISGVEVKSERPAVEYKIDKKVINVSQDLNSSSGSAVDILENIPSVTVDVQGNVSLRGSSNFTVLIDGRPTVLTSNDALQQIPASTIESIEIITNPSAKYDPTGMSGIINVILKKQKGSGLTGLINASLGTKAKAGTDFTLNYRTEKYSIFGGADIGYRDMEGFGSSDQWRKSNDTTTYILSEGDRDMVRKSGSIKLGGDYYINQNSTFTLEGSIGRNSHNNISIAKNHEWLSPGTSDIYKLNDNNSERNRDYFRITTNHQQKFEGNGHQLNSMVFYSKRISDDNDSQNEYISNSLWDKIGSPASIINTIENESAMTFRAKTDYTRPLKNGNKIETGAQIHLESDFEDYAFKQTGDTSFNAFSQLDFKQNIYAVYALFSSQKWGFEYQFGLRGEYTFRQTKHPETLNPNDLSKLDYFPSFHFSRQLKNDQQILASYSKRINRPDGWSLDPFPVYMNSYNIRMGNPALLPEYTNSFEVNYQKRINTSFISLEAYYRETNGKITRVRTLRNDGKMLMTFDNLDQDKSIGLQLMSNIDITKWFKFTIGGNYYRYELNGRISGQDISTVSNNFDIRSSAQIKITPGTRFQINGFFNGPSATAQGETKSFWTTSLSLRQDFWKGRAFATLQARDILGQAKNEFISYGNGFYTHDKFIRETGVINLSFTYRINNYKKQQRQNEEFKMESEQEPMF